MATDTQISATRRSETGKGAARSFRREGRVPGVLYGHGEESIPLSVDSQELKRLVYSVSIENTILDLALEGTKTPYKVLIRELQKHPFREDLLHIDFFQVAMDVEIAIDVPIVLKGVPIGVKDKGGVIDHQLRELSVVCLPTSIPEKVEIDVSELDIGDSIHVSDVEVPGVEIQTDGDRAVVTVLAPKVIEEEVEEEEELLEPELIGAEGEEGEAPPEEPAPAEPAPEEREKEKE